MKLQSLQFYNNSKTIELQRVKSVIILAAMELLDSEKDLGGQVAPMTNLSDVPVALTNATMSWSNTGKLCTGPRIEARDMVNWRRQKIPAIFHNLVMTKELVH